MATYNEQLQQLHAKAVAAAKSGAGATSLSTDPLVAFQAKQGTVSVPKTAPNPAATDVAKPIAPAPDPKAPPTPAPAPAPTPTSPPTPTPASTGVSGPSSMAEIAQSKAHQPAAPDYAAQLKAAQEKYLGTLAPSADITSATSALGDVASQAAQQEAAAQKQYADRVAAIQGQATLQPFLTGREQQAQQQLTNQLAAVQAGSQAQTIPLQQRLAQFQAQQQAQQEQAKAALGFATPNLTTVAPGQQLINPLTGQVVATGTDKSPFTIDQALKLAQTSTDPNILSKISQLVGLPQDQAAKKLQEMASTGDFADLKKATSAAQAVSLSPDQINAGANYFIQNGAMPALGQRSGDRVAIFARAMDILNQTGQSARIPVLNKAFNDANAQAIKTLTNQRATISTAEKTAEKNLNLALNYAGQIKLSNSPMVNRAILAWDTSVVSDPATRQYLNSIMTAANEYAKVVTNNGTAGSLTDTARSEAQQMVAAADSPDTLASVVGTMRQEMQNRMSSYDSEIQASQDMLVSGATPGQGASDNSSANGFDW